VPLIIDPLISAYEKEVFEKNKWPPKSKRAEKKRLSEAALFLKADVVVADTAAHANFFNQRLQVQPDKLCELFVGAETDIFRPAPQGTIQPPFEILFYGSFLQLQGPDVIVKAARKTQDLSAKWVLLGDGDLRNAVEGSARGLPNVVFEPWIQYDRLPERIAKAHVLLGIFGTTLKANLVIPNKVFQAMATGRPLVSRIAEAYPESIKHSDVIGWVPAGDPDALAAIVRKWLKEPEKLIDRGEETRLLFDTFFNTEELKKQLIVILKKVKCYQ
jgi:glycosyltransferase involved in cell wall biosynthesis